MTSQGTHVSEKPPPYHMILAVLPHEVISLTPPFEEYISNFTTPFLKTVLYFVDT